MAIIETTGSRTFQGPGLPPGKCQPPQDWLNTIRSYSDCNGIYCKGQNQNGKPTMVVFSALQAAARIPKPRNTLKTRNTQIPSRCLLPAAKMNSRELLTGLCNVNQCKYYSHLCDKVVVYPGRFETFSTQNSELRQSTVTIFQGPTHLAPFYSHKTGTRSIGLLSATAETATKRLFHVILTPVVDFERLQDSRRRRHLFPCERC